MKQCIRKSFKKIIEKILYAPEMLTNGSYLSGRIQGRNNVIFEGQNGALDGCNFSGKIWIGYATTLGYNNVIHGDINIGRYCQFGYNVSLISNNHPMSYLTTYINKNLFSGELKKLNKFGKITVGNDVWIGHNAVILPDVIIGNGAIIAAGAVVTKSVDPYTVVAGVPAKVIKTRFSDSIIEQLQKLKWWDKNSEELEALKPLFFRDLSGKNDLYIKKDNDHAHHS